MKTYNMEELVNDIMSAENRSATDKANEVMELMVNRAIRFDATQYSDILLDNLTNTKSSFLLYQLAYLVSMYKTANFCLNKESSKQSYVNMKNSSFSILGDAAYNSRITRPLSHELVWTDQDIDGTRQIIPVFTGVAAEVIDFIVDELYANLYKKGTDGDNTNK